MMLLRAFPTYSKRKCSCGYCDREGEKSLFRGSPVIAIIWKIGSFPVKKYYHPECALKAIAAFLREWFNEHDPELYGKPLGRPTKSLDPPRYRRLKALLRYHEGQRRLKSGLLLEDLPATSRPTHISRIIELEEEIQSLTIGGQDGHR